MQIETLGRRYTRGLLLFQILLLFKKRALHHVKFFVRANSSASGNKALRHLEAFADCFARVVFALSAVFEIFPAHAFHDIISAPIFHGAARAGNLLV